MTVATAIAALYAKYTTDLASLTVGSVHYLQAQLAIEKWNAAATAQVSRETAMIQSYSIAGRSVNYASFEGGRQAVAQLQQDVEALLYCRGSGLVDCRRESEGLE